MQKSFSAIAGLCLAAFAALPAWSFALRDENVITAVPSGFTIGKQGENGPMIISEFVPQGETVSSWTRMITVQVFRNIKGGDPNRFAEGFKPMWLSACPGSEVMKIRDGVENGYPFAVWQFTCRTIRKIASQRTCTPRSSAETMHSIPFNMPIAPR
jgi:hypothetical protein